MTEKITPSAKRSSSASGGVSLGAAFQKRYYEIGGTEDGQPKYNRWGDERYMEGGLTGSASRANTLAWCSKTIIVSWLW